MSTPNASILLYLLSFRTHAVEQDPHRLFRKLLRVLVRPVVAISMDTVILRPCPSLQA